VTALGRVVRAGVARRRVQTAVMVLTVLVAVSASILAVGLLVASEAPFEHAFARQHGAHVLAEYDAAKVNSAQLAATARAPGVTDVAGPFPSATLNARTGAATRFAPADLLLPPLTIVGRSSPHSAVDDLTLVSGRWAAKPGEIVIDADAQLPPDARQLRFSDGATLTVVGVARSVTQTADAWVTPAQLSALTTVRSYQMLYRFAHAGTSAAIAADRRALAAAVPAGALVGTASYLAVKQLADTNTATFVPFVAAFGVLALVLSVLIIAMVVSGAVGAATRRIGILKSLGFTPAQVTRAYLAQALIPAVTGAALGVLVGNLLAVPVLNGAENSYAVSGLSLPLWVSVAVPAALLVAVAVAAALPAVRAGRQSAATALAVGRTPAAGRGRTVQRVVAGWRMPRAVTLGVAGPFARPARSATMAAAVGFGAVAVTFAVGLGLSLSSVQANRELDSAGAVVVDAAPGPPVAHVPSDSAAVGGAIAAQPGTRAYYGTTQADASVSGIAGSTSVVAYQGDSSWAAHPMVSGHWLDGAGQAAVTGRFLTAAGIHVGDTLRVSSGGRSTSVRVVGEVFTFSDDGMDLLTDTSTLATLGLPAQPIQYNVALKPGTDLQPYLTALNTSLRPLGAQAGPNHAESSDVIVAMQGLIAMLTALLVVVAGLGVLNTVLLDTRERVHDLGVYKAIGMTPRQTVAMVLTSVVGIGLVASAIGVPVGIAVHHYVLPIMAGVTGEHLPSVDLAVYSPATLALLVLGGLLIAVVGALLPAGWAAATRAATALRTE
jgi:putative ABC transport system permease protein